MDKIKANRGKSQTLLSYNNIVKSENANNIESNINYKENVSNTASKCNQFKIELTNELSFKKRNFKLKENSENFVDYFGTDEKPKTTKNKKDFLLDFSRCSITLDQVSEFPELNNNIGINEYVPLPTAKFQNILKEDSSNNDAKFLRNRVRHAYIPKLGNQLTQLKTYIMAVDENNYEVDRLVDNIYQEHVQSNDSDLYISRKFIAELPASVAKEILRTGLEHSGVIHDKQKLSASMIEKLLVFSNRNDSNKIIHLSKKLHAKIDRQDLIIHRIS